MRESDIMHENGRFWVAREPFKGRTIYRVYEVNGTHSRRCATIDLPKDGLARAINECDKRARDAAFLATVPDNARKLLP